MCRIIVLTIALILFSLHIANAYEKSSQLEIALLNLKEGNINEANSYANLLIKELDDKTLQLDSYEIFERYLAILEIKLELLELTYVKKLLDDTYKIINEENLEHYNTNKLRVDFIATKLKLLEGEYEVSIKEFLAIEKESKFYFTENDKFYFDLYISIAHYYLFLRDFNLAEKYLIEAFNIADSEKNLLNSRLKLESLIALTELYRRKLDADSYSEVLYQINTLVDPNKTFFDILYYSAKKTEAYTTFELFKYKNKAITLFEELIEYTKKYLPPDHILLAEPQSALGFLISHDNENLSDEDYERSLEYFTNAFNIFVNNKEFNSFESASNLLYMGISSLQKHLSSPTYARRFLTYGVDVSNFSGDSIHILDITYRSSAYYKKLQSGDKIIQINGIPVRDIPEEEIKDLIYDYTENSKITLTILRPNSDSEFDVELTNQVIRYSLLSFAEEALCKKMGAIKRLSRSFGKDSYDYYTIIAYFSCGLALTFQEKHDEGYEMYRQASKRLEKYILDKSSKEVIEESSLGDLDELPGMFMAQLYAYLMNSIEHNKTKDELTIMANLWAKSHQVNMTSKVDRAIRTMSLKTLSKNKKLKKLVNQKELNQTYLKNLNKTYAKMLNLNSSPEDKKNIYKTINELNQENKEINEYINIHHKKDMELTNKNFPDPYIISKLIDKNEMIFMFSSIIEDQAIAVTGLSHENIYYSLTEVQKREIEYLIDKIRNNIDLNLKPKSEDFLNFPFKESHELFTALTGGLFFNNEIIENVDKLIFIVDPNYLDIPFWALTTDKYLSNNKASRDFLINAPWIAKQYAVSILPSLNSFKLLRENKIKNVSNKTFVGFGDPKLSEGDDYNENIFNVVFNRFFTKGGLVDIEQFRYLPELPDTRTELNTMMKYFGSNQSQLFFQEEANEKFIKTFNFSNSDIIAFSTHALVAGEIDSDSEPGLVLSLPEEPSTLDDGYLTASEIASLDLNADLVVLSACNTASGDKYDSEPLTGLVKSFFYAGARSLLVSNWPVETKSSTNLTTGMFRAMKNNKVSKAEALRQSILELMNNTSEDYFEHPAFWAPFILVSD